jgi:hypothetical protein
MTTPQCSSFAAAPATPTGTDSATWTDDSANASLDDESCNFLSRLHQAWSSRAPASTYAELRDELLLHREQIDARVATLSTVARIAYPQALDLDSNWQELMTLAKSIEEGGAKRKRAYREANRFRNYLVVAALWSPQLLLHYGWDKVGQTQMYNLRACATKYPRFTDDVCPRLNSILLDRHRQGIKDGRTKTLNEASIQLGRDLTISTLASASPISVENDPWLTDGSGCFPLEPGGPWLSQVRPNHFRSYLLKVDCYGAILARDQQFSQPTQVEPYSTLRSVRMRKSTSPFGQPADTFWTDYSTSSGPPPPVENTRALLDGSEEFTVDISHSLASETDLQFDPFMGASPDSSHTFGDNQSRISKQPSLHDEIHLYGHDLSPLQLSDYDDSDYAAWGALLDKHSTEAHVATPDTSQTGTSASQVSQSDSQPDQDSESESETEFCFPRDVDMDAPLEKIAETAEHVSVRQTRVSTDPVPYEPKMTALCYHQPIAKTLNKRRKPAKRRRGQLSQRSDTEILSPSRISIADPTMEEIIQIRHGDLLEKYAKRITEEACHEGASERQKSRAQWFNSRTKWASIWTHSNGSLPRGSATSPGEAEVHYFTSDEFILAARNGQVFDKPVVIKEKFMDSGMHTIDGVASQLQDARNNAVLDVRKFDDVRSTSVLVDDFVSGMQTMRLEGVDAPNLPNITRCHQPLFTMLPRFRLLQSLIRRAEGRTFGRLIASTPVDIASCTSFSVIGFEGAFSGPYLDSLCGTWRRNLAGARLWAIVPQGAMEHHWDSFAMSRCDWDPNGKQRLVLLEQDDVLLLPPGLRVVHAVHSPVKCLMEGGMLWDERNIVQTLESIRQVCQEQASTDQSIASQLPEIVGELGELVKEQPDRFRGQVSKRDFLKTFEQAVSSLKDLSCGCYHQSCDNECVCVRARRHCTAWCAQHSRTRYQNCMNESNIHIPP